MTNAQIAATFETIAKILEYESENPFRIRAYQRAAQTIANLSKSLEDIYGEEGLKGLRAIDGIGEDLALKIEELTKTGKLEYLAKLQAKVPEGILAMMEVEGVGPKKAKQVATELKVKTIADLEKVAKAGTLAQLKGWGETSASNVLRAIAQKRTVSARVPIFVALPVAQGIVDLLKDSGLCKKVEIAGSLRRRRESIGDIDILVTSTKPEKVLDLFAEMANVLRVLARGPTKCSVLLATGIQCDLRVVEPELFGAALHYFTGSKDHNVTLRTIAIKKGITMSEYGVFKGTAEKKGKLLASATEEDVFGALGLPYIPPEIRENRGEIDAAKNGNLPRLIEVEDIRGDLHCHSDFSDGALSMEEMAAAARNAGLEYIVFADHASPMGMVAGIKEKNAAQYFRKIEAARKKVKGIEILSGTEVDILADGSLYLPDDLLSKFDCVVASIHGVFKQPREEMTARLIKAIHNPHVDIIGHPTTRLLGKRNGVEMDFERVLQEAKKYDTVLELNASPERLDLDDIHCKRCTEVGVKLSIDTDAHAGTGFDYTYGISQAKRGWVTPSDVINTLPLVKLRAFLMQHKAGK